MAVPIENLSVQLSREELLFLLFTLKTDFIPGLDPDPLGELDKNQKNLSLLFAERALRARDLVNIDEKGGLVVRESLLLMIATCVYSEMMISLHHFPATTSPRMTFWHVRSGVIVSHTRPDAPLHGFALLKNSADLKQQILDGCNLLSSDGLEYPEIITTNAALKTTREDSLKNIRHAIKGLVSNGANPQSAQEICGVLAGEHSVSALHLAFQLPDKTSQQESATVLSGKTSSWLMTNLEQEKVSLKSISKQVLSEMLQRWSSSAGSGLEIPAV